jgi:TolB protein
MFGCRMAPSEMPFRAAVKLEAQEISKPSPARPPDGNTVRAVLTPRLSPDGRTLVFGAAGFLWMQPVSGGPAQRISHATALESEPAFSPDGRQLAYVRTQYGQDSVELLELATSQTRVLASGDGFSELTWSPDGRRLVAVASAGFDQEVVAFDVADGKRERLTVAGSWSPRPQLSADGRALFYSADTTGVGNLYRLALARDASPEQITHLT